MRAPIRTIGLLTCLVTIPFLAACGGGGWNTHERTFAQAVEQVDTTSLDVATRNGSIEVRAGESDMVLIEATFRARTLDRLDLMYLDIDRDETGVMVVRPVPPGGSWKNGEGCALKIEIPNADGVMARSSNGRIVAQGLGGLLDADTSNGRIIVEHHDGPVRARTSNGAIVINSPGGDVYARTSNGRVEIEGAPGHVDADTSNGSVRLSLADNATGPFLVETSNGSITLELGNSFAGTLDLRTSNGSININELINSRPVRLERLSERSVMVKLEGPDHDSRARTSNGSIRVRGPGKL